MFALALWGWHNRLVSIAGAGENFPVIRYR